ncbi:unnamed protein product [marine sediment metagenome]|uniref:Uncharacterized protein n=1 Tax=marine sediment metagenome TaxID=412755 RepID=X0Z729_9ZZZZ
MPAVPEGGHAQFQVWTVKILRQFKAQQVTQTDSDIRVTCEIKIDPQRVCV